MSRYKWDDFSIILAGVENVIHLFCDWCGSPFVPDSYGCCCKCGGPIDRSEALTLNRKE